VYLELSGLESREYSRRDPSRWPRCTLYPQKLALTSTTSGGCSVGIVRSETQAMEFFLFLYLELYTNNSEGTKLKRNYIWRYWNNNKKLTATALQRSAADYTAPGPFRTFCFIALLLVSRPLDTCCPLVLALSPLSNQHAVTSLSS
jgi:hypothetical protein